MLNKLKVNKRNLNIKNDVSDLPQDKEAIGVFDKANPSQPSEWQRLDHEEKLQFVLMIVMSAVLVALTLLLVGRLALDIVYRH